MNHFELDEDLQEGQYIHRSPIKEVEQESVLPALFGSDQLRYETHMAQWLDVLTRRVLEIGYNGGNWTYFRLTNEGIYRCVTYPTYLTVWGSTDDYCSVFSSDAACVIANVFALADLAAQSPAGPFTRLHAALLEYAQQHPERIKILYFLNMPLPAGFGPQMPI